ncbi:MAG: glycoside hydrolase family 5 protein [Puniceicoccaceae bacterium]|nr:MAG: glycoside hydrolase family 5 protein [Puniceicoccaceae bacterium]
METANPTPFRLHKGTNVSHWLSQSKARGAERRAFFTREDIERLAGLGFDHLRLPIDEEQMWKEDGSREPEAFDLLDAGLDWALEAGLNVVVDLHILRSHYFNDKNEPRLYTDPAERGRFLDLWRDLSSHLRSRPVDRVAYEFLNEAVARHPDRWNDVSGAAFDCLRAAEPERWLLLGSNQFNSVFTYGDLRVPEDDRLILTFHYYRPMLVTHYRASWTNVGVYDGPVQYPGRPIPEAAFAALDPELQALLTPDNEPHDRARMVREMSLPLDVARSKNCPLYCGEFGVYRAAPADVRAAWYRDFFSVVDELGIAWANWDYKGGFGLANVAG